MTNISALFRILHRMAVKHTPGVVGD